MDQESKKLKKLQVTTLATCLVLLVIMSVTYAWLTLRLDSDSVNILKAGSLDLVLDDETADGILIEKAIPQSYQQGITNTEYNFTLTNNGTTAVDYKLSLEDLELESSEVRMADSKVRYILVKNNEAKDASNSKLVSEADDRIIDEGTIEKDETINYTLQVWIDSKVTNEVMGQIFYTRLKIDAIQSSNLVEAYYAFGTPSSETATNWKTLLFPNNEKAYIFNRLGLDDLHSVCIDDNGLFCINNGEYELTKSKLFEHFGNNGGGCADLDYRYECSNSDFSCAADSIGNVDCTHTKSSAYCGAYSNNKYTCTMN